MSDQITEAMIANAITKTEIDEIVRKLQIESAAATVAVQTAVARMKPLMTQQVADQISAATAHSVEISRLIGLAAIRGVELVMAAHPVPQTWPNW